MILRLARVNEDDHGAFPSIGARREAASDERASGAPAAAVVHRHAIVLTSRWGAAETPRAAHARRPRCRGPHAAAPVSRANSESRAKVSYNVPRIAVRYSTSGARAATIVVRPAHASRLASKEG